MDSISGGIQFLQNSQSFVATIATIVAMCVLFKKNANFIYEIHNKIFERIKKQSDSQSSSTKVNFDKLDNDDSYKLLTKCNREDGTVSSEVLKEKENLLLEINNWKYNTQISSIQKEVKMNPDGVHQSCFYVLLFILGTFIFDELLSAIHISTVVNGITLFFCGILILSCIYWTIKWVSLLTNAIKSIIEKKVFFSWSGRSVQKIGLFCIYVLLSIISVAFIFDERLRAILLSMVGKIMTLFFCGILILSYIYWTIKWISFLINAIKSKIVKKTIFHGYEELLKKIGLFCIISLVISIVIVWIDMRLDSFEIILSKRHFTALKYFSLIFMFLYGFLVPFSMPLLSLIIKLYIINKLKPIFKQLKVYWKCRLFLRKVKNVTCKVSASGLDGKPQE